MAKRKKRKALAMTNAPKNTKHVDTQRHTERYVGRTPRTIPPGRLVIHNHVRPPGFPKVSIGDNGFRVWTDVERPTQYHVVPCDCGWAPHLREHYRVLLDGPGEEKA